MLLLKSIYTNLSLQYSKTTYTISSTLNVIYTNLSLQYSKTTN